MKVLIVAPYLYFQQYKEFAKNKTGFGYMVDDIARGIAEKHETFFLSHVITSGHKENYSIVKHSWSMVAFRLNIQDALQGLKYALCYKLPLFQRLRFLYYYLDKGIARYLFKKIKPNIVHIHGATYQTKPYVELCKELNLSYLVTLHGLNGISEKNLATSYDREYEKSLLSTCSEENVPITVVSSGIRNEIKNKYHIDISNIRVILNGTSCEIGDSTEKIADGFFKIICVGNISERKNQIQIIRAFSLLPEEIMKKVKIFFFGNNSENIPIVDLINQEHYCENIQYCGFVERSEMSSIWKNIDLNIVASVEEGFGLSIIEGYAFGVPTLTFSDLEAVNDLFDDRCMELINERTDKAMSQGIIKSLNRTWDSSVIKCFSENFSLVNTCNQYSELYTNNHIE